MKEKKDRRTPRRSEVQAVRRTRAGLMREWVQDRIGQAQKRNQPARRRKESGNGVTLEMKSISREAVQREPEWVVKHSSPNRAMRRSGHARGAQGTNTPYVAPTNGQMVARRLMDRVKARRSS